MKLERALHELTVGVTHSMRKRDERDREMGLSEIMQQFQVRISGTGGSVFGFATVQIDFDYPFHYAPGQRDPDFARPQFWFGAECTPAMAVSAVVSAWGDDPHNGATISCNVDIGVAGPEQSFEGVAHLTFQGFSALAEAETDIE